MLKFLQLRGFSQFKFSAWALIIANALSLLGVLFLGWDAFAIVALYWSENVVIGVINVLKMITCSPDADLLVLASVDPNDTLNRERMQRSRGNSLRALRLANHGSKLLFVPFFIFHYGLFCLAHGEVIFVIFDRESGGFGPFGGFDNFFHVFREEHLWWCVAALAASHLWSFVVNYIGHGEYRRTAVPILMFQPYARIVVLHVAILIGGFIAFMLGNNILVLMVLIAGKTLLDLSLHLAQHAANSRLSTDELPEVILGDASQTLPTPPATEPSHRPVRSTSGD